MTALTSGSAIDLNSLFEMLYANVRMSSTDDGQRTLSSRIRIATEGTRSQRLSVFAGAASPQTTASAISDISIHSYQESAANIDLLACMPRKFQLLSFLYITDPQTRRYVFKFFQALLFVRL
ncbi:hypothetical protein ANCCAN_16657 [Ancylostoma caninum]|uniref:Uncharacterized protein n=1 Tax=Ancylostoma caninum TaxID=29170 RepID=A0A368G332_ANCCA|nr:hypothetical protein ANCCAN_16657 [Ancylostoma caninum]